MMLDYRDIINMQRKYPGVTKQMMDIYEWTNNESLNLYPTKSHASSENEDDAQQY